MLPPIRLILLYAVYQSIQLASALRNSSVQSEIPNQCRREIFKTEATKLEKNLNRPFDINQLNGTCSKYYLKCSHKSGSLDTSLVERRDHKNGIALRLFHVAESNAANCLAVMITIKENGLLVKRKFYIYDRNAIETTTMISKYNVKLDHNYNITLRQIPNGNEIYELKKSPNSCQLEVLKDFDRVLEHSFTAAYEDCAGTLGDMRQSLAEEICEKYKGKSRVPERRQIVEERLFIIAGENCIVFLLDQCQAKLHKEMSKALLGSLQNEAKFCEIDITMEMRYDFMVGLCQQYNSTTGEEIPSLESNLELKDHCQFEMSETESSLGFIVGISVFSFLIVVAAITVLRCRNQINRALNRWKILLSYTAPVGEPATVEMLNENPAGNTDLLLNAGNMLRTENMVCAENQLISENLPNTENLLNVDTLLNTEPPSLFILYREGCEVLNVFLKNLSLILDDHGVRVKIALCEQTTIDAEGGIKVFTENNILSCDYTIIILTEALSDDTYGVHKAFDFGIHLIRSRVNGAMDCRKYIPIFLDGTPEQQRDLLPPFLEFSVCQNFHLPSHFESLLNKLLGEVTTTRLDELRMANMRNFAKDMLLPHHPRCRSCNCNKGNVDPTVSCLSSTYLPGGSRSTVNLTCEQRALPCDDTHPGYNFNMRNFFQSLPYSPRFCEVNQQTRSTPALNLIRGDDFLFTDVMGNRIQNTIAE